MSSLSNHEQSKNSLKKEETIIIFSEPTRHFRHLGDCVREDFKNQKQFCDVRIVHKGGSILAHSEILHTFLVNYSFQRELIVVDLLGDSVNSCLKWMYHGTIELKIDNIADDLDAMFTLGIYELRSNVEEKLLELAKNKEECLRILQIVTKKLRFIPHNSSIILHISNETFEKLIQILHDHLKNGILYQEMLRLSTNSTVAMVNAAIEDVKKVDIVNTALKWIYERQESDQLATTILQSITFRHMSYEMLVNFRNTLIKTAVPVKRGRCVSIRQIGTDKFDIVFGKDLDMSRISDKSNKGLRSGISLEKTCKASFSSSSSLSPTEIQSPINSSGSASPSQAEPLTQDCTTAMSFRYSELERN